VGGSGVGKCRCARSHDAPSRPGSPAFGLTARVARSAGDSCWWSSGLSARVARSAGDSCWWSSGLPARASAGDPRHHGAVPTTEEHPVNGPLERLIDNWCERRDLRPLALLLPAYTSNAGLTDDWAGLMDALHDLQSRGRLPAAERDEVERLLSIVERMVHRS
jgi:hypothetical protein